MASIWDVEYVALDIETTGLFPNGDRVVEVGALKFRPNEEIDMFQTLVDPGCSIPWQATRIHGIKDSMVLGMPSVEEVVCQLIDYVGGRPLVLHNARFDLSFLNPVIRRIGKRWKTDIFYDTVLLSRRLFPGLPSYSLKNLSNHFGFDMNRHHRAISDCVNCRMIFERSLEVFGGMGDVEYEPFAVAYSNVCHDI